MDDATNADVMLGMPDFRVIKATRSSATNRLEVVVETISPSRRCPDCAVVGVVKERSRVRLADVTMGGTPSLLVCAKRRFSCVEPTCARGSWIRKSAAPTRIFDAVRPVMHASGVLASKTRRVLDSTVLEDAVARQDTVTMLVSQIRKVRRLIPQ